METIVFINFMYAVIKVGKCGLQLESAKVLIKCDW